MYQKKKTKEQLAEEISSLQRQIDVLESNRINLHVGEVEIELLTENTIVGIFVIQEGKMVYVNKSLAALLGYSPEEIIDRLSPTDVIHPDDISILLNRLQDRLDGRPPGGIVSNRVVRKDGTVIYLDVYGIFTHFRGHTAIMGTVVNVTDRKKAELALRESENKYRTLFENANDAIFLMRDDVFIDCNHKTLELFECTRDKIVGRSPFDWSPPLQPDGSDSVTKAREFIRAAFAGIPQRFEWLHTKSDRTVFFAEVSLSCIEVGGEKLLLALVRDITERKKAELALRESEGKFRALTENSPDVIMRFDRRYRHLYVNPIVHEKTGIPAADFIGKTHDELGFPPDLCRKWQNAIRYVFETGEKNRIEFQLPNGVYIESLLSPECDDAGRVTAVIISARDISEKKQLELREKMLMRIQRLASFGGLASAIAHEIRQPLNLIKVISDTYLFFHREGDEAALADIDIPKNMKEISRGVDRINEITTNLQALMRSPDKIEKGLHNVNEIIRELLGLFRQKLSSHHILLDARLDESIGTLTLSPVQFQEILTNLLNNAIDALDSVERENKQITVITENRGDSVAVAVADNGTGVSDSLKEKIFDPMFSTKQGEDSMGLGLYIVKTIVDALGGRIRVSDNELGGATFEIVLKNDGGKNGAAAREPRP
jgi:PAS domain S-box-containing protein